MGRTPTKIANHPHHRNPNLTVITAYKCSDNRLFESETNALNHQEFVDECEANKGFLPWKYCECGCKGHELIISKDCQFWCFQPEPIGKSFVVRTGHCSQGKHLGTYKSWREVDEALAPIIKKAAGDFKGVLKMIADWERSSKKAG